MEFTFSINLNDNPSNIFNCLCNVKTILALNPQWEVKDLKMPDCICEGCNFELLIKYDRTEKEVFFKVNLRDMLKDSLVSFDLQAKDAPLNNRMIKFQIEPNNDKTALVYIEQRNTDLAEEERREIILWLRSIGNYLLICSRRTPWGRLWRFFVDKCWLKMSPAGRRMVFILFFFEVLTLLVLVIFILFKLVF